MVRLPKCQAKRQAVSLQSAFSLLEVAMTEQTINAIEAILAKDDRVELIPMPGGGVKVIRIRRDVVKTK